MSFAFSQRPDIRAQQITQDSARRKRESEAVSLRKQAREEYIQKRRITPFQDDSVVKDDAMKKISQYNRYIYSDNQEHQLEAVTGLQKLLSVAKPPINEIINSGVVTTMINFLNHTNEDIQYMSLWAITNIAAGQHEHASYLYQQGSVPLIISVIECSPSVKIREQACWALGNLAGDCPDLRDKVLDSGAMPVVLGLLTQTEARISLLKTATWTLSNLCRGRPSPLFEKIKDAVPVAARLIYSADRDVEVDALWALAFLSEGANVNQEAVAHIEVCKRLVTLLNSNEIRLLVPSIRTIGNLMSGDDATTQRVLDSGVLQALPNLLTHTKAGVRKEACWTVSNVLAGPPEQIRLVVDAKLIEIILQLLHTDREDIQREAAWCIANAVSGSNTALIYDFVQYYNVIPEIIKLLFNTKDSRLIESALDAVGRILRVGQRIAYNSENHINPYLVKIEDCNGVTILSELQGHEDNEIFKKTGEILNTFWAQPEDTSDGSNLGYNWEQEC